MIYFELAAFAAFTAAGAICFCLSFWQKQAKEFLALVMLGLVFISIAGMAWPHQVVTGAG